MDAQKIFVLVGILLFMRLCMAEDYQGTPLQIEKKSLECGIKTSDQLKDNQIFIGYSLKGLASINPLVIIEDGKFIEFSGKSLEHHPTFYSLPGYQVMKYQFSAYYSDIEGKCIHYAALPKKSKKHSLFSTAKISLNLSVSAQHRDDFYALNKTCVDQGDWIEGQEPPCSKPNLIAVSDLNKNSRTEYWYADPYKWEWGFTVAEVSDSGEKLIDIVRVCPDCD